MTMKAADLYDRVESAAGLIARKIAESPEIAIVLGSGLGSLAERLLDSVTIPYAEIPHFPTPTVHGHHGNLMVGMLGSARVACLQGRFHYYEGHDLEAVTFPVRVLKALGVRTLILTAATGGIRADLRPGDLVCLADHLNLLGSNPLRGPNDDRLGLRFPDMTTVYAPALRKFAADEAGRLGFTLSEGVYACLPGPSYETPAEIRMLRILGADVVGMSTVPEAIVARQSGLEVLAFALVTNAAAGITGATITHEEVIEAGRAAGEQLGAIIEAVLTRINRNRTPEPIEDPPG
jgi:purine-nucleoside phosphorylase